MAISNSLILLVSSVSLTLASFALQPAVVHPSRPNTCFNKGTNSFHENGESWPLSGCGVGTCMKIQDKMMISYESCGAVGYEPPCYVEEDKEASFPDCCPQVICPDSSEQEYEVNNDLSTSPNNTLDAINIKPEQVAEKEYYDEEAESKARKWRNTIDQADFSDNEITDVYLLDDEDDSSYEDSAENKNHPHFTKKISPKFFYWV